MESESRKILFVKSAILGFGIRNRTNELRIQVPLTKTRIQYLKSGIHDVESTIQNCLGFSYMGRNIHLVLSWTRNLYGKNEVSAEIIVWYAMDSNKKKLLDRIADITMIHETSSAQNALDHLKDYCSNSWTTKPRVQCRLFNRVLKRWIAQLISVILFRWIVIYPVDSAIQPPGGGHFLIRG